MYPCFSNNERVLDQYNLPANVLDALMKNISKRLTPQAIKIRADLEVMCFAYDGIDAIKEALTAAEQLSTEEMPIKIKLVAPPLYVMMTNSLDKAAGIKLLEDACALIKSKVTARGGELNIKTAPRAVSERDDRLLGILMEALEKQNQEVAADDPEED